MASPPNPLAAANDMAASPILDHALSHQQGSSPQQGQQQQPKRYRPAPAKTFQCRGYGDCRMVFSRSEHLARHIRKHTGERPFTCHCGKQFSRLDNLRQHAQTVHADKAEQNERMMRELTSLHASMAAANKATQHRGKRQTSNGAGSQTTPSPIDPSESSPLSAKQEDVAAQLNLSYQQQRPGTTAGYEVGYGQPDLFHHPGSRSQWHVQTADIDRPHRTQPSPFSPQDPATTAHSSPDNSNSNAANDPSPPNSATMRHNPQLQIPQQRDSHPSQRSSPRSPIHVNGASPHSQFFSAHPQHPLAQAQLQQRTTPPNVLLSAGPAQDLDWHHLAANNIYSDQQQQAAAAASAPWPSNGSVPPTAGRPPHHSGTSLENTAHRLPSGADPSAIPHFPSTLPRSPNHPSPANAPTPPDQTTTNNGEFRPPSVPEGQSHDLSLGGSPSWNSAMSPMEMHQHYYRLHQAREQQQQQHHARAPPPSSSRTSLSSHSPIPPNQAYAQELRRQQTAQLQQLQRHQQAGFEDTQAAYQPMYHQPPPQPQRYFALEQGMYPQAVDEPRGLLSTPPL